MQMRDVGQENAPLGFFPLVILGTFRFFEKNDALFSHCREESTTGSSVTGVSKPHLQRGRSLVICSCLLVYHCAHVSGSTSAAKIKGSQFWFCSFLSLYLANGSLKCELTSCTVTQEMMRTMEEADYILFMLILCQSISVPS